MELAFAALSDISMVISFPSSSALGFSLTTVDRHDGFVENSRVVSYRTDRASW